MQDVPGTAQGIWFSSEVGHTGTEDPHLALVHSNTRPDWAAMSVGNSIQSLNSGVYRFLPKNQGLLNRDFSEITPDGQIYGFQVTNLNLSRNVFNGITIVMMPDAETLWIERLRSATTNPTSWAFTENKSIFLR